MATQNDEDSQVILSKELSEFTDVTTEYEESRDTHVILKDGFLGCSECNISDDNAILNKQKSTQSEDCLILKLFRMTCKGKVKGINKLDCFATARNDEKMSIAVKNTQRPIKRKELNVLTSYRLNDFNKKAAFTLAEVLITLGIIGIVAAMTLPTLIGNYKRKELRTQLLKTYSEIQQINSRMIADEYVFKDISDVYQRADLFRTYFKGKWVLDPNTDWVNSIERVTALYKNKGLYPNIGNSFVHVTCDNGGVFSDNSGRLWLFNDTDQQICVDINGLKGPNRYGYDYFVFYPNNKNQIVPHYTDIENEFHIASLKNNGDYTYYALIDEHPNDSSKSYWKDYINLK